MALLVCRSGNSSNTAFWVETPFGWVGPTFWRNISLPFSGSVSNPRNKAGARRLQAFLSKLRGITT
jgi:hypothetical protein